METHHGVPLELWNDLKAEIARELTIVARRQSTIAYSDLVRRISTFGLEANSRALHEILGEISVEENEWGRGLLSVVVVHKQGEQKPGQGFFTLAANLGRDVSDKEACWIDELKHVYQCHRR